MSLENRFEYFRLASIKYIFHHHYWANEELRVPVSRHYYLSSFGVRQRHDSSVAEGGEYLCLGVPGTGFFVHSTDSHSYHQFVRQIRQKYGNSFGNMIFGREPNYSREMKKVDAALKLETNPRKQKILVNYRNCLTIGQEAELLQRLEKGVKAKAGHRLDKGAIGIITNLKGQIASLQHDMLAAETKPLENLTEEQQEKWQEVLKTFAEFIVSRRLFSIEKNEKTGKDEYHHVFGDFGIFDFMWMRGDTPLLRDSKGNYYFIFPIGLIKAKSSTDFEVIPVSELSIEYQPTDISTLSTGNAAVFNIENLKHRKRNGTGPTDAMNCLYGISSKGQMAYISCPQVGLRILCSKMEYAQHFANALIEMIRVMNS
jgi:hypothetical protein